ncbi:hypothetical protein N220_04195 [Mannheimia haemolytica USMARC_2286]|nr:methionine synthase vitamin-B12 independent [Mannheimia haemolytica M42548]AGQ26641.1 hypothetical protein F382_12065 [Mannheimia haemolytica D153]AGQ39616.1 hypothetical protein J450_11030 [Mannheimia haemolytica D171]AGQ42186.1 hypothetical protein J451_12185 [Mannheimia haemolytica D174]AGR74584.1 hypothetical protein N220_04195 [Mannheimia haemolytica USMARC_2286]EEY11220.1 hypothetical protein COI_0158 [Mannheimia haemolytica serotype A2 str. OVINE]EEY11879.1 hypothetical protein COK_
MCHFSSPTPVLQEFILSQLAKAHNQFIGFLIEKISPKDESDS